MLDNIIVHNELIKLREYLESIGIHTDKWQVVYSAAMVVNNIKQTCNDIDITMDKDAFDVLKQHGHTALLYKGEEDHWYIPYSTSIDIFWGYDLGRGCMTIPKVKKVYGINIQTPESLLCEKKARGREKDLKDAELIEKYIRLKGYVMRPGEATVGTNSIGMGVIEKLSPYRFYKEKKED